MPRKIDRWKSGPQIRECAGKIFEAIDKCRVADEPFNSVKLDALRKTDCNKYGKQVWTCAFRLLKFHGIVRLENATSGYILTFKGVQQVARGGQYRVEP